MRNPETPRPLSHDERHAAEAAFAGRPFNPTWSTKARVVYDGIVKTLPSPPVVQEETPALPTTQPIEAGTAESVGLAEQSDEPLSQKAVPSKIPFKQALEAGALIDVTPTARQLGLSFPVTVTKPLWDLGIAPRQVMTQEERLARLRDVLMAFRLRLATQPTISPLIDFPALLAIPPDNVPQPIPLFALIQPDDQNRASATLLLPDEVSPSIIPLN
jgi:hypothetical protein